MPRAIDCWVNTNMGDAVPPEFLKRVAEDYFKRSDVDVQELHARRARRADGRRRRREGDRHDRRASRPRRRCSRSRSSTPIASRSPSSVDPRRGMKAVRELEGLVKNEPVVLARVTPFMVGGIPPTDYRYFPLYTKCIDWKLPISINTGLPGPPMPGACQDPMHLDEICYFLPELVIVMAHGADPWWNVAIRLMIKYKNLHLMTSAYAPKYFPPELIQFMNTRGKHKILFASDHPGARLRALHRRRPRSFRCATACSTCSSTRTQASSSSRREPHERPTGSRRERRAHRAARARVSVPPLGRSGDRPLLHRRCATASSSACATRDGRVLVPPPSTTPRPATRLDEFVDGRARRRRHDVGVGDAAARRSSRSIARSRGRSIKLDGADTAHAARGRRRRRVARCGTGMRVVPRWRAERAGDIRDIECFEPESKSWRKSRSPSPASRRRCASSTRYSAGDATSRFLRGIAQGKHPRAALPELPEGLRAAARLVPDAAACRPPKRSRSRTRAPSRPSASCACRPRASTVPPPFACAHVLLDGADLPFFSAHPGVSRRRGPHGHARRGGVGAEGGARPDASRASATSGRSTSPTRRSRSYKEHRLMRDVAVVSFAQAPSVRRELGATRSRCCMPVVREAVERAGIPRERDRLHLLGLAATTSPGQPFAFVMRARRGRRVAADRRVARRDGRRVGALRGVGEDSSTGEVDTALVYAFGKSSLGDLPEVLTTAARSLLRGAALARRDLARRAAGARLPRGERQERARPRRGRGAQPARRASESERAARGRLRRRRRCSRRRTSRRRCASTTARRSPTAPRRSCSPRGDLAREGLRAAGVDPRHRPSHRAARARRARPHASRRRRSSPARRPGVGDGAGRRRRAARAVHAPGADPARRARPRRRRARQPVGRRARREPDDGRRPDPHRRGRRSGSSTATRKRAVAHATSGPCLQQNLVCVLEGELMAERCAVVGIGQTQARRQARRRLDRRACCARRSMRALDDAGVTWRDIDAVVDRQGARHVRGRDDARAVPRRRARRGRQADAARAHRRQRRRLDGDRRGEPRPGRHPRARADRRLREAVARATRCGRSRPKIPFQPAVVAGAGGYFAPLIRAYMRALGRARATSASGRAEGPPNALQESVRAPARCPTSPSR